MIKIHDNFYISDDIQFIFNDDLLYIEDKDNYMVLDKKNIEDLKWFIKNIINKP